VQETKMRILRFDCMHSAIYSFVCEYMYVTGEWYLRCILRNTSDQRDILYTHTDNIKWNSSAN